MDNTDFATPIDSRRHYNPKMQQQTTERSARDVAIGWLMRRTKQFPDLQPTSAEVSEREAAHLSERDAALARAIELAAVRNWLTLTTVLDHYLRQPFEQLEPAMQAVLLAGAAQLLYLDRVPDHAAIDEAVTWARENIRPKAGGLVNAVLRKVAALQPGDRQPIDLQRRDHLLREDGSAFVLKEPVFADDPIQRLCQQTSHPGALIDRWIAAFGLDRTRELALHDLVHPPLLLADVPPGYDNAHIIPHQRSGFAVFAGSGSELRQLLRDQPQVRVQDPATATAVDTVADERFKTIVDFCAGRGTKTMQLAAQHPEATIVATDPDPQRFDILKRAFENHPTVRVQATPSLIEWRGMADLVITDVPCSNTGVIPRRPEAKYRYSSASVQSLLELQQQILFDAFPLLNPQGQLLYVTCSVDPLENERQAAWISRHLPLTVVKQEMIWPAGQPGDAPSAYHDGGFVSLFRQR